MLVLAGLAALATLLLALRALLDRPQRGLLALAALAPFHGLLVIAPVGDVASYWKEALVLTTLGATFLAPRTALRGPGARSAGPAPSLPWWPAAAALVVLGSVSALATAGLVGLIAIKITFFYLLVVVALFRAPFSARDRDTLVSILMAVGLVVAVVGLWQQLVGAQHLVDLGYSYNVQVRTAGGLLRSFSTFDAPFAFGLYVMLSLVVGGAAALAEPGRLRNRLFLLATTVMVAGMGVSIVRASYVALAVGLLWLGLHRHPRLLALLGGAVVATAVVAGFVSPRVVSTLFSSSSLGERGSGWSAIISDVLSHPLGLGLGASGSAADKMAEASGRSAALTYQPDNYYVKMILELGPLGLWLFVLVLVCALVSCLRAARFLRGRDAALAVGVSASVLGAAAASLFATYLEIFPLDIYFWLLLGSVGCAVSQRAAGLTSARQAPRSEEVAASASAPSPCVPVAAGSRPTPAS